MDLTDVLQVNLARADRNVTGAAGGFAGAGCATGDTGVRAINGQRLGNGQVVAGRANAADAHIARVAVTAGGILEDQAFAIAIDDEGGVAVTGVFQDVVDFDPGEGTDEHSGQSVGGDVFVWKFRDDLAQPFLLPGIGQQGETRPFSGYVDPRAESINGELLNFGLEEVSRK